ncbi:MAG: hypothetical protein DWP97_05555 [Calditrichaeota bacterium]|nr:MAG: hypothetical protein DWP97_05555 [Calditrichota bacterium]
MIQRISSQVSYYGFARNIQNSFAGMYSSLEKLSSGFSINSAKDGPASLIISEQFRSQISSLNQQIENTSMLIGKYNTASSSLMEARSQLTELRSLAVGASNEGVNDEAMLGAYDTSADAIVDTYNTFISTSEYNGQPLFDGSEFALADLSGIEGVDLSSAESAQATIETIDAKIAELDSAMVDIGATQKNDLEAQLNSMRIRRENLTAAESVIRSTDYVSEFSNFLAHQIRAKASIAMLAHFNASQEMMLSIFD